MNLATSIYGILLLILLWHLFNGWRKGPARMLIKVFALAAAYVGALLLAEPVAGLFKGLGYPNTLLLFLARLVVGLVVYLVTVGCGAILFKRTSQQELGLLRLAYGFAGGAIGLLFGAIGAWLLIIFVRVTGTLVPPPQPAGTGASVEASAGRSVSALTRGLGVLRTWKMELEDGPLNGLVRALDPLREQDYESADRVGILLASPERLKKFWDSAAMREWANDLRAKELANDPELAKLVREGDYGALLRHPKIVAFLDDPELMARVKRMNWEAALREAVPETRPKPGTKPEGTAR